jgi:hypothetical protein
MTYIWIQKSISILRFQSAPKYQFMLVEGRSNEGKWVLIINYPLNIHIIRLKLKIVT